MRISKTTHNALQILIAAARAGDTLVKGSAIAKELDLTAQNTSKIVYLLSRGGFIKSVRGPQGGMTLARKPGDIRIGDVVLSMERMALESESTDARGDLTGLFDVALDAFVSVLNQYTLADMARSRNRGPLSALTPNKRQKPSRARSKPAVVSIRRDSMRSARLTGKS
jgi:Rrf2 family nitric oxide-sensitive transcriptional repressor